MQTSENINELAAALSKAQSQMTGAHKSAANPFFKSKYSDLASVIEAISKPFGDNDLAFVQGAGFCEGMVRVTTRIIHASGQWVEDYTDLPPVKSDPQAFGSAITYAKRYGLQALAGVPSVDDDGNAAAESAHAAEDDYKALCAKFADTITEIKAGIATEDYESAAEAWFELTHDEKLSLWRAPTKGGCFTIKERKIMQSPEFQQHRPQEAK